MTNGISSHACTNCGRPAMHSISHRAITTYFCCTCYVTAGNPPSDWHPKCMETYERNPTINEFKGYAGLDASQRGPTAEEVVLAARKKWDEFMRRKP